MKKDTGSCPRAKNGKEIVIELRVVTIHLSQEKCTGESFLQLALVRQMSITLLFFFLFSLRGNYGPVFSLKLGSYKFVMASTPEAVKEMLISKSTDYAGRPQTYSVKTRTLGKAFCTLFVN